MKRFVHMDELRDHLIQAEKRLAEEKDDILQAAPLTGPCNREEYAFAYVRTERLGLKALSQKLATLDWLPLQLDVHPEMMGTNREPMKRWIKSSGNCASSADFGNDFMHALTRASIIDGWNTPRCQNLMSRITNLFCDLSCLISAAYYTNWLAEKNVEKVQLTAPDDLQQTTCELAALMQSPGFIKHIRTAKKKTAENTEPDETPPAPKKKPKLHVVKDPSGNGPKS